MGDLVGAAVSVVVTVTVMKVDPAKLREAAAKHMVSRATILAAIAGQPIRGRAAQARCQAALRDLGVLDVEESSRGSRYCDMCNELKIQEVNLSVPLTFEDEEG